MSELTGSLALAPEAGFPSLERRAAERVPSALQAAYRVFGAEDVGRARVRDLSPLGVRLILPQPVPCGALLHLDFQRENGETICSTLARVVHAAEDRPDLIGCAFVRELNDASLRLFDAQRLPTTAGDDRRWVRFPCNVETACYAVDAAPGEQSPARVINISAGGMGLLLPCEFGPGTLLNLDLEGTPAHAAGPALLRVVRVVSRPAGDWFLGCEFARRLDAAEIDAIRTSRPNRG
jgi:hypothetical protein